MRPAQWGETVNIAAGESISLNQAWAMLAEIVGTELPSPLYAPIRSGDVRHSQVDIAKAERLLGYRVTVPFREGLRRTVGWASGEPQSDEFGPVL